MSCIQENDDNQNVVVNVEQMEEDNTNIDDPGESHEQPITDNVKF